MKMHFILQLVQCSLKQGLVQNAIVFMAPILQKQADLRLLITILSRLFIAALKSCPIYQRERELQICNRVFEGVSQLEKGVFSQVVTEIGAKFAQKNFLILPYLYRVARKRRPLLNSRNSNFVYFWRNLSFQTNSAQIVLY